MDFEKIFCLFEQSGTFKNVFKSYGYDAFDIDILNDYGETDYVLDIFQEVDKFFEGNASIFDEITHKDLILSFFPCINFTEKFFLNASAKQFAHKKSSLKTKVLYSKNKMLEMAKFYDYFCKIVLIALKKNIKMIVENPSTNLHILKTFFPKSPSLIINNRANYGDDYKKPTAFWFFNCEPSNNYIFEDIRKEKTKIISFTLSQFKKKGFDSEFYKNERKKRSLITPDFADRFIREFIFSQEKADQIFKDRFCNT